jgi:hypothetical protein
MIFSIMILGFILFKERKLPVPKKIQAIINIHHPKIHNIFKYLMGWHNFINLFKKNCCYYGTQNDQKDKYLFLDQRMLEALGIDQTKVY